jgi:hypothetical protein
MILSGCDIIDFPSTYNPEKAGATIVESYDLSRQLNIGKYDYVSDLTIYNDKIYILAEEVISIFKKDNFEKTSEIQVAILNKPDDGAEIEYSELVIVNEEKGFISCSLSYREDDSYSYVYSLISVNMKTGEAKLLDMRKSVEEKIERMGYDKINDYIWFSSYYSHNGDIYFYKYDSIVDNFLFVKKIENISNSDDFHYISNIFIAGDEWFYTGYSLGYFRPTNTDIFKYDVNTPGERIYCIRTEYLELDERGSNHILYDEPYIWMMVKKDDKLQMLKLLPNE